MADDLAVLTYKVQVLQTKVDEQGAEIKAMKAEEKRRLIWGIGALGGAVLSLAGVIWSYREVIFRG